MPEDENVSTALLFGNESENEGEAGEAGEEEAGASVLGSLPVFPAATTATTATTAAPLKTNVLSKKKKKETNAKPVSPGTKKKRNDATAKRKATQATPEYIAEAAKREADREALEQKTLEQYGKLLYGVTINGETVLAPTAAQRRANPAAKVATALEVKRINDIFNKLKSENAGTTLIEATAEYKVQLAAKPKREKLGSAEKENRKTIRGKMRKAGINPSMARLTAYRTKRSNFNNINFKFNKNNTDKNRETKKKARSNLFTFLKGYASPELKGLRKAKANAKAALESFREAAEAELKLLRTEAQIKKGAGVNPASITHLAMLRQAGYKIKAKEFKELSTLVKKGEMVKLKDDPNMKLLIAQSSTKDACDRCILNTIFGVRVK